MSGLHAQEIFVRKHRNKNVPYTDLAPVFINENHWIVVLISNITVTVSYINSIGTTEDASLSIITKWKAFCSTVNLFKGKKWNLDELEHELQTDGDSCGNFICMFMEKFVTYNYYYKFDSSKGNMKKIRQHIHNQLRDNASITYYLLIIFLVFNLK